MDIVDSIQRLRDLTSDWRMNRQCIGFVPTMGNLHAGHLKLVEQAKISSDKVVVSIFVNPIQFSAGEDFESYPRTESQDIRLLSDAGVDLLFMPSVDAIYQSDRQTLVSVNPISNWYCGASRPGHFDGVVTVVAKLFNIVQPTQAFFGQKDYQQLTIIKRMVADLNFPLGIVSVETVRDKNGLALSSRNAYLTEAERQQASLLYRSLCQARLQIESGNENLIDIETKALQSLEQTGLTPDYFKICRADTLEPARTFGMDLVILVAAKLGKARLIDNIVVPYNEIRNTV